MKKKQSVRSNGKVPMQTTAVLVPQDKDIRSLRQFMKLSNVKISSRITCSYGASELPILKLFDRQNEVV